MALTVGGSPNVVLYLSEDTRDGILKRQPGARNRKCLSYSKAQEDCGG